MDENNIIKKKSKNNYYRHHNQNKYYYKRKKKKNLILENSEEVENILLYNEQETKPRPIVQVIKENIPDYEEEDILIEKKESNIKKFINSNILKYSLGIALIFMVVLSSSYAYFNYTRVDSREANVVAGDMYVKLMENSTSISFSKMYPRTDEEARSKNDNYFDFTIKGKNTSTTKPLLYSINVMNGDAVSEKERINSTYIKVDLQEKVNGEYVYIKEGVSLNEYSFMDNIPINTTSEITREYRIRLWIGDNLIVSDIDSNASYTEDEFSNLFATYNIRVDSYDGI